MTPRRSLESQRRKARIDHFLDTFITIAAALLVLLFVLTMLLLSYNYLVG